MKSVVKIFGYVHRLEKSFQTLMLASNNAVSNVTATCVHARKLHLRYNNIPTLQGDKIPSHRMMNEMEIINAILLTANALRLMTVIWALFRISFFVAYIELHQQ